MITKSDKEFIRLKLLPWAGVKGVRIAYSRSNAKWPDIWLSYEAGLPKITITNEWRKQNMAERRKRLVHEIIGHLHFGWEHNSFMDSIGFSTYPNKDTMSWKIYKDLVKGRMKTANVYTSEAL